MRANPADLVFEERIIWLEDVDKLDYVRSYLSTHEPRRRGRPCWRMGRLVGRLVGWSDLRADAPNNGAPGTFTRRVFWLKNYDRAAGGPVNIYRTGAPCEAVDPRTIWRGVPGQMTDRACGRPFAEQETRP
jgi:hypothetical protein